MTIESLEMLYDLEVLHNSERKVRIFILVGKKKWNGTSTIIICMLRIIRIMNYVYGMDGSWHVSNFLVIALGLFQVSCIFFFDRGL